MRSVGNLEPEPSVLTLLEPIHVHAARGTTARPEARQFGPARARPGPMLQAVLGPTLEPAGWRGTTRLFRVGPAAARHSLSPQHVAA